jgi:3-deoxy-manno-octulosonate cytidylyltransferase (CMP-KDO synthetase)
LPGKPLLDIHGQPMIWHVHQQALASGAARVIIATDDQRIERAALAFNAEVMLTASTHLSGTDRVAEAARLAGATAETIIVNVQGDEPLMPPALIRQTATCLATQADADMATLCEPIQSRAQLFNPSVVKVVRDRNDFALYFSRAPIPWLRDTFNTDSTALPPALHFRHLGIYAYRGAYLQTCTQFPPCALEHGEALEQLRVLYQGGRLLVAEAETPAGLGVDTEADLQQVRAYLATGSLT